MEAIKFDAGIKEYSVNDMYTIRFNPTDSHFAESLYDTFDELDKKQDEWNNEKSGSGREVFCRNRERDAQMREMIDGVLGDGACDALFGKMNVYSLADGLPVWANLLLALIDEMSDAVKAEQQKTSSRVEKYIARYKK